MDREEQDEALRILEADDEETEREEAEVEEVEVEVEVEVEGASPRKRRRRRRKVTSPAHEARIEEYRLLVEGRGWIFAPPSPVQPVSALFKHLTDTQVESLSA